MFAIIEHSRLDSTHQWAIKNLGRLPKRPLFITAQEQTRGIGRKGNPWISQASCQAQENLYGTFVFPIKCAPSLQNIAQLLIYSAMKTLESLHLQPLFKWPNDILLSSKKMAGGMAEIKDQHAIASIGMNVNMPKEILSLIGAPATSLLAETERPFNLQDLQNRLMQTFSSALTQFLVSGFTPFFQDFSTKLAFLGERALVGSKTIGTIEGLHPDGRICMSIEGQRRYFSTGSLICKQI